MTGEEPRVTVRVTRRFDAAPERVFDAWLTPTMIEQWMFGPKLRDEKILRIEADARVGGSFSFLVLRQGTEIDHVGHYLEIDRPRRLVFTWGIAQESAEESRVSIDITPLNSGCELELTHVMDAKWAEYADRTRAGWTTMLDALARTFGSDDQRL
ncbi:MAG TPA: SRPBCC family protein [Steroidobacteraceae bacterium]